MKRVVFAGSGTLVQRLIEASLRQCQIVAVVLTEKMSQGALADMRTFCSSKGIPWQYGFDGLEADAYLTPNWPLLLKSAFLYERLCVNVHFALLPKYRGFHPVQCALLNNEPAVGYTVHLVDEGVDSGPIYFQESIEVTDTDTIHTLNARLTNHLVANFAGYLREILNGKQPLPQDESKAIWGGKRHPDDGLINWCDTSRQIFNLVRAVCPPSYPGAYTFWKDKKVIINATTEHRTHAYRHIPGQVVEAREGRGLLVKTGDMLLWVTGVQIDGGEAGPAERVIGRRIGLRFTSRPTTHQ